MYGTLRGSFHHTPKPPPRRRCWPHRRCTCSTGVSWGEALWEGLRYALHFLGCGIGPWRIARHDKYNLLLADSARKEMKAIVSTVGRLCTSAISGTKIDTVIEADGAEPPITTLDVTVSCSLLPSYVRAASKDSNAIFTTRDKEKKDKHFQPCVELLRSYLTVVVTTLGAIGPASARDYIDSFFRRSYADEILAGGTGTDTARRRQNLSFALACSIARSNLAMILGLTAPAGAYAAAAATAAQPNP